LPSARAAATNPSASRDEASKKSSTANDANSGAPHDAGAGRPPTDVAESLTLPRCVGRSMGKTYVDTEVEVEVDSTELEVEAGEEDEFEAELNAPGISIEIEAEIAVAGEREDSESDADSGDAEVDGDEAEEYLEPESEGMALDDSEPEELSDLE